jgi:catalase
VPQGGSAHDTFWDFVGQNHETAHMVMWAMSDRGIPRSLRMMEGFGVHTFRLVNAEGKAHFVKFHWKPKLGVHSQVWDEAQKAVGKNADFHRVDLYEAINKGDYPEWELGLQLIPEEDEFNYDFDILDPTKLWPEEEIPVKLVGKMTLNRNVDNFFAETEQVAFHPGHLVPGIDFSNDPLLQGRLFSYTDTQLSRLGGPNFHQIPINKPVCPFHNNQRDGMHQMAVHKGQTSYHKNALNNNQPEPVPADQGGFEHYQEKVDGHKIRGRSDSFLDFYSQAKLFYNSMTDVEKQHIQDACSFELGKCESDMVKENAVDLLNRIDRHLAEVVADNLGVQVPEENNEVQSDKTSPALSMANTIKKPDTKSVALLLAGDVDANQVKQWVKQLADHNVNYSLVGKKAYMLGDLKVKETYDTVDSSLFDAAFLVSAATSVEDDVLEFIENTYKHYKPLALHVHHKEALATCRVKTDQPGVFTFDAHNLDGFDTFIDGIATARFWDRA